MQFRPCIDLHQGMVKQIVGSSLNDDGSVVTNFETRQAASYYANLYRRDGLTGGHVIMLGPGNETAAELALSTYPDGLQVGGGITTKNAATWLDKGASKVIVTSYLFLNGNVCWDRLHELKAAVSREKLVLDLSCRIVDNAYRVVSDRWQTVTDLAITPQHLDLLAEFCSEFLIHAVDVEGKQNGVETPLVELLGQISPLPTTYAGGVGNLSDIRLVEKAGNGRLDVTVGSALDIFGGSGLRYKDMVAFDLNQRNQTTQGQHR